WRTGTARHPVTLVSVSRLFCNVPPRLKLVESARRQAAHIAQLVQAYALANPGVSFVLQVDGKQVLRASGSGDPRAALADLLGPNVAASLRPIAEVRLQSGARLGGSIGGRLV